MRLVVQRVSEAQVKVGGESVGAIGPGLMVLLGIHRQDTATLIPWMVNKLLHLRIFSDEEGKMNKSILDVKGQVLIVSQFTLYGNCTNGRRPDFLEAAPPVIALPIYEQFIEQLRQQIEVQTGQFGAAMELALVNQGPVTLVIDSERY